MIKRTLYFGNPAYLKTKNEQLVAEIPKTDEVKTAAIEDIGVVILDHQQITITQALLAKLLENNTAVITCNATHHPTGLLLNLEGHTLQSQRFQSQIEASLPLKKQLWQQTVIYKIQNQSRHLALRSRDNLYLENLMNSVRSGDPGNAEAKAAAFYWRNLMEDQTDFTRDRYGIPPNNLLNYGYAILRAIVARSLVGSGLLPTLGIFHRNQYNAYCLADDIMEPFRPYVDQLVLNHFDPKDYKDQLGPEDKKILLNLPTIDVEIEGQKSPLMVGVQRTTASLAKCFEGSSRKILYPIMR